MPESSATHAARRPARCSSGPESDSARSKSAISVTRRSSIWKCAYENKTAKPPDVGRLRGGRDWIDSFVGQTFLSAAILWQAGMPAPLYELQLIPVVKLRLHNVGDFGGVGR